MREIKFRGKRIDNGEWVYGYYSVVNINHGIWSRFESQFPQWYQVHPETVGEYTGLTDKNGKEIYEVDKTSNGEYIVFEDGIFGTTYNGNSQGVARLSQKRCNSIEVIGNIYETPELLKS